MITVQLLLYSKAKVKMAYQIDKTNLIELLNYQWERKDNAFVRISALSTVMARTNWIPAVLFLSMKNSLQIYLFLMFYA